MAIAASAEALADAGIDPEALSLDERRAIGVVLGTGGGPIEFSERMYHLYYTNQVKKASVYAIASGTIGTLSSEISMRFGLRGLSHVVSTGCASSTDALGYAFRSIKFGTADVVLTGGVDATVVRGIMEGFVMMRVVSTAREREPRPRLAALLRATATASCSARAPGCSSSRSSSARGPAARASTPRSAATARPATPTTACGWTRRGEESARAMTLALGRGRPRSRGDRLRRVPRHLDGAERPGRDARRAPGLRRRRGPDPGLLDQVDDRPSAGRLRRGGPRGDACSACATASCRRRSTSTIPTPSATSTTSRTARGRPRFANALCNCIGFGSKNTALVVSRT